MSVSYQQEFLHTAKDDCLSLIQEHYAEVYPSRDTFDLNMDWEAYENLERIGYLKIFTARASEDIIGYLWVITSPNIHSKGSYVAMDDGLFVAKSHRGGSVAIKLIKFAEKCLKEDGFKVFCISGTEENPIDPLMKRLGYSKIETKYQKVL